jgi:hypothetical protein
MLRSIQTGIRTNYPTLLHGWGLPNPSIMHILDSGSGRLYRGLVERAMNGSTARGY